MQKAPRVGACLMNGLPAMDEDGGRLVIAFAADKEFQVGMIREECGLIAETATRLWQRPVKVELVLGDRGQDAAVREDIRREVAPTRSEELDQACANDPVLGSLVEMMDAAPLPEGECDKWEDKAD